MTGRDIDETVRPPPTEARKAIAASRGRFLPLSRSMSEAATTSMVVDEVTVDADDTWAVDGRRAASKAFQYPPFRIAPSLLELR